MRQDMSDASTWDLSRTAILTIDLQNDFLHPEGAYGRAAQGCEAISALPMRIAPLINSLLDCTSSQEIASVLGQGRFRTRQFWPRSDRISGSSRLHHREGGLLGLLSDTS